MVDPKHLKKPEHVKAHIWQQHLNWMDVVGKQVEENCRLRQKQLANSEAMQRKNQAPDSRSAGVH